MHRRRLTLRHVRWTLVFVALATLAAFVISCATNPATGRREFSLVSASQEEQIGRDGYTGVVEEYGLYDDPKLAAYVDSIGQRLAKSSQLPNLAWKFSLLDDPVVNAFAMPGGYIYVTRGILAHLGSEAQLAGVIGHEIGHVTARHTAKRITQQQLMGLGLGIASAASETFRRYSGPAEQALGLMLLKYGRDDENQADALGITYAAASNWDPRQIPLTYQMLARVGERAGQRLPAFLSTHPEPGDREARTTTLASQAAAGHTGLEVRERAYLDRIQGIVYGEDPRQGYFESGRFYQPALGFEIVMPAGWRTQNGRSAVVAVAPEQRAQMQLTLARAGTLAPDAFVASLRQSGAITDASGGRETVGGWPAWVGRIAIPTKDGGSVVAVAGFIRQNAERMYQMIGQSAASGNADEQTIVASIRSLRPLQDAGRAHPEPARLKIAAATAAGTFEEAIRGLGDGGLKIDELCELNNRDADESVLAGTRLKTITPARH